MGQLLSIWQGRRLVGCFCCRAAEGMPPSLATVMNGLTGPQTNPSAASGA
ncbi:hypothetical protein [Verrucomicrobium spinosum]|nr:hypothetical protein [Verrucomicrobium spinosum]